MVNKWAETIDTIYRELMGYENVTEKEKKRHLKKIKLDKEGKFYGYLKTGKYVREELATRHGCSDKYRVKEVKPGVKILLCIREGKGKRGGRTKALAILRDVNRDLRHYVRREPDVYRALKKARKIKIKLTKKNKKKDTKKK